MQIKKEEYLPNPALHAIEPLLNNFYNHCVNSHKRLKMLFPRFCFWHSVVSLIFQIDKGGNLVYD